MFSRCTCSLTRRIIVAYFVLDHVVFVTSCLSIILACYICLNIPEKNIIKTWKGKNILSFREQGRNYAFGSLCYLSRFRFFRSGSSNQSVPKRNARVVRTGSGQNGPAHGSEQLSSPAPVGQSAGIWRVVAGTTSFKLTKTSSFRPVITDKWKVTLAITNQKIVASVFDEIVLATF